MFIRLATGYSILMFRVKCVTTRLSRRPINKSIVKVWDGARNEGERYTWEWWVSEGVYTFLVCIRQSANRYVLVKWGYKVLMRVTPKVKVFCGWSCCCRRRRRLVEKNINWRKLRTWQKDYKRKKGRLAFVIFCPFILRPFVHSISQPLSFSSKDISLLKLPLQRSTFLG